MVELKCPECGAHIGQLKIKQIRFMVKKLIKSLPNLSELDLKATMAEIEAMDKAERDKEEFECTSCKHGGIPIDAAYCCYCGDKFEEDEPIEDERDNEDTEPR